VLLLPEGMGRAHKLVRGVKQGDEVVEEYFDDCTFVPLLSGVN
jgi:protein-L-isoaspartate(D-aspartate) O-methyltransferase